MTIEQQTNKMQVQNGTVDMQASLEPNGSERVTVGPEQLDLLYTTQNLIELAVTKLGRSRAVSDLLKEPLRTLTVRFPVTMDDGSVRVFTGWRVQHNDATGPTEGGIRLHPDISESDLKARAMWMSVKCGIANIPFGGGKGGISCDPREMSFHEIERVSRAYVRSISQIVGPTKDIPAPDMFSNSQTMAWMLDEYAHLREFDSPNFITGKPQVLGGTRGREHATANGVAFCIEEAAKFRNLALQGARVVVQGFGNTGSYLAKTLSDAGARVVGISDAYGALYEPKGLPINDLLERRDSFGSVTKLYRNTLTNRELLESPCDILVLAAAENQITTENAQRIQAPIVVEATNGTSTLGATKILHDNGTLLVPDVLGNAGDVIVAYFEWAQNTQGLHWAEEDVTRRLHTIVEQSFERVCKTAQKYQVDMRLAAYMVGIKRLAEAATLRGWV